MAASSAASAAVEQAGRFVESHPVAAGVIAVGTVAVAAAVVGGVVLAVGGAESAKVVALGLFGLLYSMLNR